MKKYLSFLAVSLAVFSLSVSTANAESIFDTENSFQLTKSFKLGRSADVLTSNGEIGRITGDGKGGDDLGGGESGRKLCNSNCTNCNTKTGVCSECIPGYYVSAGSCAKCSASCKTCSSSASACTSCYANTRLSGNKCVSNCEGVVCSDGYSPRVNASGCCCKSSCGDFKVYNTKISKCVDMVCPGNCSDCSKGYCVSCNSGYYLSYTDGMCPSCSSAVSNCATCTSKTTGGATCTKCNAGYYLNNGDCTACPTGATCDGSGTFTCNSGYIKSGAGCIKCPANCTSCSDSSTCTTCATGYIKFYPTAGGVTCTEAPTLPTTGCGANMQDCGSTGCCPTDNTCAYYAQQAASGKAMCLLDFDVVEKEVSTTTYNCSNCVGGGSTITGICSDGVSLCLKLNNVQ